MRKTGLSLMTLLTLMTLVAVVLGPSAQAGAGFQAVAYDSGPGLAAWHANEGASLTGGNGHAMHLEVPWDEARQRGRPSVGGEGGAGVDIEGVGGITLSELGFDIRNGETCDRWLGPHLVVYTADGSFSFECATGLRAPSPNDPLNWTRVRFTDAGARGDPWPGFGNVVVTDIFMYLLDGRVHLDNFDINGVLIGGPGSRH